MLTKAINAHTSAAISGSLTIRNDGWYSASCTLTYTLSGQKFKQVVNNITLGVQKIVNIPEGATDITFMVEEWWGFGWSQIFEVQFPSPVTKCYLVWGTTLDPKWKEVPGCKY